MKRLISENWYKHQAVLMALAINERLLERDHDVSGVDPLWGTALFKGLLGLEIEGKDDQLLAINPIAFPKSVRSRLAKLARHSQFNGWGNAQFFQERNDPGSRTAKLIATLAHNRTVPPKTLWRTAREELSGVPLPPIEKVHDHLNALTGALRSLMSGGRKLEHITGFMASVPELSAAWPALEPALVQPVLDWVPVSVGDGGALGRPGVMIPILVEVSSGAEHEKVKIEGTFQDTTNLNRSVHVALDRACALWQNRYNNAPDVRRREVDNAKVRIDLHLIEGTVQACVQTPGSPLDPGETLNLDGRSLELPLALAIYYRLTGTKPQGEIRASGTLDGFRKDRQDPKSGTTYLGPVSATRAKALAAEEQLVDRFVLSKGSEIPSVNVPTVFAATLGAAVDCVFGSNGDGHRFVRGADLAESFKDENFTDGEVEAFKKTLKSSQTIHSTNKPLSLVLQALYDVSKRLGQTEKYKSRGRYTIVRLSNTERADAAWASIWSALDGDASDFDAFSKAGSFRRRAELFVKQMARKRSSMKDPRWSPHVLVVAGVKPNNSIGGLNGGVYRRFDIARIMAEAETLLHEAHSPCDHRLKIRIGSTRVILVSDDGMDAIKACSPSALPDDIHQAVMKLSAFRYGFSFDMARRQLGSADAPMRDEDCAELLERLQMVSCEDGKPLLVVGQTNEYRRRTAPTAFEYMLRRRHQPLEPEARIKNHENAAHAIAPALHPARNEAHLGLAASLSAPWLDEAYYQLSSARSIAIEDNRKQDRSRLQGLRIRLLRLAGWFLLERVPAMMGQKGNEEVYWDFAERLYPTAHPALHARAAHFATVTAANMTDPAAKRLLYTQVLNHLNNAAKNCDDLGDMEERKGAMFLIASERCRLAHMGCNEPDGVLAAKYRNIRTYAPLAVRYLPHMREIYWFDWFAQVGDLTDDEEQACEIYRAGLWNEALPGTLEPDDEALIGWAGTLGPGSSISQDLLSLIRQHLVIGFFTRREIVDKRERTLGILFSDRRRRGMARLYRIDDIRRAVNT